MKVIGIVGGVASGKSLVTQCLARAGAAVLNADQLGHAVLREPEVIEALVNRWGTTILDAEGQINRSAVAGIVFPPGQEAEKDFLESQSHPRIGERIKSQLAAWREAGESAIAVLDAPIMLEKGWAHVCDEIWFVDTPDELRRQRALDRGWSAEQWLAREAAQWPVERKRQAASQVIDNRGSPEETCRQVAAILRHSA